MPFLAFLAQPAIAGLIKWGIGAAVAYFTAKPLIEKWGSTPNNRAANLGISPQDIHDYARKDKKDKLDYVKEKTEARNKELEDEIERRRSKIREKTNQRNSRMKRWDRSSRKSS